MAILVQGDVSASVRCTLWQAHEPHGAPAWGASFVTVGPVGVLRRGHARLLVGAACAAVLITARSSAGAERGELVGRAAPAPRLRQASA